MRILKQFFIILAVTCAGELLHHFLPFPVPGSIYGLVLMFVLLCLHIIPLESVKETAQFLIAIMPLMFIPAAVGLLDAWDVLHPVLLPVLVIIPVTTVVVMVVTGKTAQGLMRRFRKKRRNNGGKEGARQKHE